MPIPDPYIAESASLKIGVGGVEYICHARTLGLMPNVLEVNVETFCTPGTTKKVHQNSTLKTTIVQSFGVEGSFNKLTALVGQKVTVTILPDSAAAVSVTNPSATFQAFMPPIPFIDGKLLDVTTFELSMDSIGKPVIAFAP